MTAPNTGLIQRASGLYIPTAGMEKHAHTLTKDDWRKFKSAIRMAQGHGMTARFLCRDCHAPIQLLQHDRLIVELEHVPQPGGRFTLECQCRVWTIR